MDLTRPHAAICPTLDSGVLVVLAGTSRALTGREIARLLGRKSPSGVLDSLNRLTEHGLVDREEAGRAFLFTLNREHLAAGAVDVLANMRSQLFDRISEAVSSWEVPPVHLSLFGSMARGEGGTSSDIDLFVVRPRAIDREDPRWREQLDLLTRQVQRWTGNLTAISEVDQDELSRLGTEKAAILAELRADAITLAGAETSALLGKA